LIYSPVMSDPARPGSAAASAMGWFLTVSEVARNLRVSNMTVYRLIKSGQLSAVRVGRGYRIREDDVRRYLQQRYMDAG
jgi:excisionase family DNA binding protein